MDRPWIVNRYFQFQVNIFNDNRAIKYVKVFVRQRQDHGNTLGFLRKQQARNVW